MGVLNRIFPPAQARQPDAVAAPTAASGGSAAHACPQCGTAAAAGQGWCLECGTRIESARPRWHQPAAVMASVALIFVAGLALALSEVAKDAETAKAKTVRKLVAAPPPPTSATTPDVPADQDPGADEPAPSTSRNDTDDDGASSSDDSASSDDLGAGSSSPSFPSSGSSFPSTSPAPTPAPEPTAAKWPEGKKAWTVVLLSTTSKKEATEYALKAREKDIPAGILRSNDYKSLGSGLWLVWAGRFTSEDKAYDAADAYEAKGFTGENVRYVRAKGGEESPPEDTSGEGSTSGNDPADENSPR